jgi:hypothetical protein
MNDTGETTMQMNDESCHGVFECLEAGSKRWALSLILKPWQKVYSYAVWHVENLGWSRGLKDLCLGVCSCRSAAAQRSDRETASPLPEALGLLPGEWVEVKPIEEILATLDGNRRNKGLRWMTGMKKYCGKRCRVYRKVERIMLETNSEMRSMKNTVLLAGATCDGTAFNGCDRSCFHFWREVWLKRMPEPPRGDDKAASLGGASEP